MNVPNNIMTYTDLNTKEVNNLYSSAISLNTPNILNFIDYQKILKYNETLFDPQSDFYIYKSIQVLLSPDISVYGNDVNIKKIFDREDITVYTDNIVTQYLPFISNCEVLGGHITFKDMLEHPSCNLVTKQDTTRFTFINFFATAQADSCDYTVKCFYDERFDV